MDISIDFTNGSAFGCPVCGGKTIVCKTEHETWHHFDFFTFAAYLYARVPHVHCSSCGVHPVERPWTNGSQFSRME